MNDHSPQSSLYYSTARPFESARADEHQAVLTYQALLVAGAAFAVYFLSAIYLDLRDGTSYFGADPDYYEVMARHIYDYTAARFHPATVLLGLGWMKVFSPLEIWIAPHLILKAMFAVIGAIGVLGAILAFTVLLPRGYGLIAGMIYASSLGVWYFAAIPESKILTASLSTLYIGVYALYRDDWTTPRTIGLNAILAVACFNEIVAGFLVAIPAVDALLRGIVWSRVRWIAIQVAVGLAALFVLEVLVNGWIVPKSASQHEHSHFALFLAYLARFSFDPAKFDDFAANWLLFNIAAPTPFAWWWPETGGYFEPSISAYRWSPIAMATMGVIAALVAAGWMFRDRYRSFGAAGGLLLPLAAYAIVRAIFFILFVPNEALLFSPAVTLPHWLFVLVPFVASRFPAKKAVLVGLCGLLIATNAGFMFGPDDWTTVWGRIAGP